MPEVVLAQTGDRSLFPELKALAYCNHASISPPSQAVQQRVAQALLDHAQLGLEAYPIWKERREGLRARLSELVGAQPSEIGYVPSTTRALGDVALSIPWKAGDRVLLFRGEFPANIAPWQCAARHFQLELRWLDADRFRSEAALQQLEGELQRGLRLVAVSAVQFQTGLAMPLQAMGKLCKQYGAELCVDAIQALGVVPLDVEQCAIDYLACGSHKWLMGAGGAGFVYVRSDAAKQLRPLTVGWRSHVDCDAFLRQGKGLLRYDRPLQESAQVFESSSPFMLAFAALEASLELLQQVGVPAIFAHVQRWHDAIEPLLEQRGLRSLRARRPQGRSGTLALEPPPGISAPQLRDALCARGVACAAPDGILRLSPHWPNSLAEVERIVGVLDEILV